MDDKICVIFAIISLTSGHFDRDEDILYIVRKIVDRSGAGDDCITREYLGQTVGQLFSHISATLADKVPLNRSVLNGRKYATKKDLEKAFRELLVNISSITNREDGKTPTVTSKAKLDDEETTVDTPKPRDCQDVQNQGQNSTGVYQIYPGAGNRGINVRCDMDTAGGGWTVFQRRVSQSDFHRNWTDYEHGFGNVSSNFWLGNDIIHSITNQGNYQLRIDLTSAENERAFAKYKEFSVGDSDSDYKLFLNGYSGNAGDSLASHSGMKFSTYDNDNDNYVGHACAVLHTGAWWYNACHHSNLNGLYGKKEYGKGINWYTWKGYTESMKTTEMKIRKSG